MRKMLMLGAGMLLLGTSGLAVAQTATPPGPPPGAAATPPPPPPGGPAGGPGGGPGGPGRPGMGGPGMGGPGMGGPEMMMRPHRPPSRAASFELERGETSISVRCAENETMQACVAAATAMLDKMNSISR